MGIKRFLGIQTETLARTGTTSTTSTLTCRGLANGRDKQGLYANTGVINLLLAEARVDDVHHSVDGDGGFGNVGGNDHFSTAGGSRFEYKLLLLRRKS